MVKNAEGKSCDEISDEIRLFWKEKNSAGQLTLDDMSGATCTISSLGNGNDIVLPMLNDDQCVMLGAGSVKKKPVVLEDGSIAARDIMNMSWHDKSLYSIRIRRWRKFCIDIAEILENAEKYLD